MYVCMYVSIHTYIGQTFTEYMWLYCMPILLNNPIISVQSICDH